MICVKCGFNNPGNSKYCAKCGASFEEMMKELRKRENIAKETVPCVNHEIRDAGDFTFTNRKTCKKCGTPYESAWRKHSYYLIRWILSGIAVQMLWELFVVISAFKMIETDDTEILKYYLYVIILSIPLTLLPLHHLSSLVENLLGITKVSCPKCWNTGEFVYYSRCLKKYPLKRNVISGIIENIYDKVHKHNIFSLLGIVWAILNLLSFTPYVVVSIMGKPFEMPYINWMICSIPAMIFFIFGMLCVNTGAQLAYIPSLNIRRVPLILSVSGAVLNIVSTMCMTHKALLKNISRIVSVKDIELTSDLLQVSMGSVKFGIVFINFLVIICAYFSYHTEQLVRTRNLNKHNLREN